MEKIPGDEMDRRAENYDSLQCNEQYVLLPLALKYLHRSSHGRMIFVWGLLSAVIVATVRYLDSSEWCVFGMNADLNVPAQAVLTNHPRNFFFILMCGFGIMVLLYRPWIVWRVSHSPTCKHDDFVARETLCTKMHHKVVCRGLWLLTWLWVLFFFSSHSPLYSHMGQLPRWYGSVAAGASGTQGSRESWKKCMREGIKWWQ